MADAEVADVFTRTRTTLGQARAALNQMDSVDPGERMAGMRNVMWGGVAPILQQLRSRVEGFDEWYAPWREEMEQDPLLSWIYRLRNEVLKEGQDPPTTRSTFIKELSPRRPLPPPPPNALGSFIFSDALGGDGWPVRLPDGSVGMHYVRLPEEIGGTTVEFQNLPDEHLGAPLADRSIQAVCHLYVEYLTRLTDAAEARFG